jgi:hypothetical protein
MAPRMSCLLLGGVAGVYNRFKYRDEVRVALQMWTAHIGQLAGRDLQHTPQAKMVSE